MSLFRTVFWGLALAVLVAVIAACTENIGDSQYDRSAWGGSPWERDA